MAAILVAATLAFTPVQLDAQILARVMYTECRHVSRVQQDAVCWVVLNRLESGYWGDTLLEVVTAPGQFVYSSNIKVLPELEEVAEDVLAQWQAEKDLDQLLPTADVLEKREELGDKIHRRLPSDVMYFYGDGKRNHFFKTEKGRRVEVEPIQTEDPEESEK